MKLKTDHSFPPVIIREILLKLPVESLLRCKCVCKEWYTLISNRQFIKSHYTLSSSTNNINYQHHRLIYTTDEPGSNLYSCHLYDVLFDKPAMNVLRLKNPLQRPRGLGIVGSCNGLVCLFVGYYDYDYDYDFFIYNPSTRISNGLPVRRRNNQPYGRCSSCYSFCYDESTDDYKIVEMSTTKKVNIYSLKTGKWKFIGDYSYGYTRNSCGIFSNGALHWVAYDNSSYNKQRIVSLELSKETFGEVLLPEGCKSLSLGVLRECLCALSYYWESHADLWVMKVYGVKDSWTKLASIPYLNHEDWINKYPVPFFISNDGNVLFKYGLDLVIYKLKDSSFEYFDRCKACVVVESLVSPFPPLALADNNEY